MLLGAALARSSASAFGSGIVWFVSTSDRGSIEVTNRNMTMCIVEEIEQAIFLDNDCWEHSCQLCVLGSLKLVDSMVKHGLPAKHQRSWRYCSSIATVCNVCRDIARDVCEMWKKHYGAESALKYARKLFPRCCAGRWLSISTAEERIIAAGEQKLKVVLQEALANKSKPENDEYDDDLQASAGGSSKSAKNKKVDESRRYPCG